MQDRSSRPHRSPNRTPHQLVRKVVHLRWKQRLGPVAIGGTAGDAGLDRARGAGAVPAEPAAPRRHAHRGADPPLRARQPGVDDPRRREEARQHPRRRRLALRRPAAGRTEPGSDARHRPQQAPQPADAAPRSCTPSSTTTPGSPTPRSTTTRPPPPPSACCAGPCPGSPPAASPSSGSCPTTAPPTSPTPGATPAPSSASRPKKTRPYRPQTNGKIERFHRTLADGWAFSRHYNTESARRNALPAWLHALQSPQAPHRHRQGPTHQPVNQPAWAVHLARSDQASKTPEGPEACGDAPYHQA